MDIERKNFLRECHEDNKKQLFEQFKQEFVDKLFKKYGIGINDCTDEDQLKTEFEDGFTPDEFIEFIADKYNLEPIN